MTFFKRALPVWPAGRQGEMNLTCCFKTVFPGGNGYVLRLTASTLYRVLLNGQFLAYGPARAPHGMFRVDEIALPASPPGRNDVLVVEVAGYNTNSYYMPLHSSFLQAELLCGGEVVAATGAGGFAPRLLSERMQRVQKYSFQREFTEVYRLDGAYADWAVSERQDAGAPELSVCSGVKLLERTVPLPKYRMWNAEEIVQTGTVGFDNVPEVPFADRALLGEEAYIFTFKKDELECCLSDEGQRMAFQPGNRGAAKLSGETRIPADSYAILDFSRNVSGFICCTFRCEGPATVWLLFDEVLKDGDVDFLRGGCCNAVKLELSPGTHRFESFESYTMRYLKVVVSGAATSIGSLGIRRYQSGVALLPPPELDEELMLIYNGAVDTFLDNAVDLLTDCPSRERAGWLCDTFFTARAEWALTGDNQIERAFLENYLLPERFENIPDGMLPMNYPADDQEKVYIPNWALWLVVELHDYFRRTGDRKLVERFKPKIERLFRWFLPFENEYGLLESLSGWVFIEWSMANELTQDVSFPTNMLYSYALRLAGELYGESAFTAKSQAVAAAVNKLAFDGDFYNDNALRRGGRLELSGQRTEVCQYYAFFCEIASPRTHGRLWETLVNEFGHDRKMTKRHSEIHYANAFIGYYLRLEIFSRLHMYERLKEEIRDYFLDMAKLTGTLWEYDSIEASCCHGFTSVIAFWLRGQEGCA